MMITMGQSQARFTMILIKMPIMIGEGGSARPKQECLLRPYKWLFL